MTSKYLAALTAEQRAELHVRLLRRQGGVCFICEQQVDIELQSGQLDVDHIDPQVADGLDAENNFALTHASCNRSKGVANLQIARWMSKFDRIQEDARNAGERGANLGHVLNLYGGGKEAIRLRRNGSTIEYSLSAIGDNVLRTAAVHHDRLSGMDSFFAELPIEYLHHDDRINPRSIGVSLRRLVEEFEKGRPQLHSALAWWHGEDGEPGTIRVFDGQHKTAAQMLLGVRSLPVRVFVSPDTDVLLQANTNAGGKLKQVAFDTAVMHHLGSSLYEERVTQYKKMRGLSESDFSFSESDLVGFFGGERREMLKYILDAQKDRVMSHPNNRLREFVEWAGKGATLPLSYAAIDRSFFKEFLYKKALTSALDEGLEQGENPRLLEREQLVEIMSLYAEVVFVDRWDPDIGGRRLESRVQQGESIPDAHLRAWRLGREEVLANVLRWVRLVMAHYYAMRMKVVREDRLLQTRVPDELWEAIRNFFVHLAGLPCWVDHELSGVVFGSKQNLDFWERVFDTGQAPSQIQVLAEGLSVIDMIKAPGAQSP